MMDTNMKQFITVIPIFFGIAFFFIIFFVMSYRRKKNMELLEQISLRRGGTIKKGLLFNYPTLTFSYGSHEVSVHSTPGSKNSPPKTRISCLLNSGRDFKMSVYKESIVLKSFKFFGAQDIEVGNDEFDREFMVKGDDDSSVKALLTPQIQQRLLTLTRRGMNLSLNQRELQLAVNYIPSSEMDYDPILDAFTAVLDVVKAGNF
jgi:hypothetical protein